MSKPDTVAARSCPVCGKPAVQQFRPFCSRRCGDVDLHRWLSDSYVPPAMRDEEEPSDGLPSSGQREGETL